jgi:hypothetical protein
LLTALQLRRTRAELSRLSGPALATSTVALAAASSSSSSSSLAPPPPLLSTLHCGSVGPAAFVSHVSWALSDVCADHFTTSAMNGSAAAEVDTLLRQAMQSAQTSDSDNAIGNHAVGVSIAIEKERQSRVSMPVASPTVFWARVVGAWLGARLQQSSPSSSLPSSLSSHAHSEVPSSSYVPLSSSAPPSTSLLDAMLHTSALISANLLDESSSSLSSSSASSHRARASASAGMSLLSGATSAADYESPLLLFRAFRNSRHFATVAPTRAADSATYRYVHICLVQYALFKWHQNRHMY